MDEDQNIVAAEPQITAQVDSTPATEPVAVEQVTTPEPVVTPTPTPQVNPFLSQAREYLGANWQSEQEAIRDIARMRQELDRQREFAQFGQQVLPYQSEFRKFLEAQQAQPAPQPEPLPAYRHGLDNAQVAKAIQQFGIYDERQARYVAAPEAPQWAKDHIEKYQDWFDRHRTNLFSDKADEYLEQMGFVRKTQLDTIKEEIRQELASQFQAREAAAFAQKQFVDVAPKVFQMNADGRPVVDPIGRPIYTDWGRAFHAAVNQLEADGLTDPAKVRRYAEAMASQAEYERAIATQKIEADQRRRVGLPPQVSSPSTRIAPVTRQEAPVQPNSSLGSLLKASGFNESDYEEMKRELGAY